MYGTTQFFVFDVFLFAVFSVVHATPAVRTTPLRQMDIGSLTCAQIWVRNVHTKRERGGGWWEVVGHKEVGTRDEDMPIKSHRHLYYDGTSKQVG